MVLRISSLVLLLGAFDQATLLHASEKKLPANLLGQRKHASSVVINDKTIRKFEEDKTTYLDEEPPFGDMYETETEHMDNDTPEAEIEEVVDVGPMEKALGLSSTFRGLSFVAAIMALSVGVYIGEKWYKRRADAMRNYQDISDAFSGFSDDEALYL